MLHRAAALALGLTLALAGTARAELFKEFKDWTTVCDNLRACTAMTFAGQEYQDAAYIIVGRGAGPAAQAKLVLSVMASDDAAGQKPVDWRVLLDGKPLAGFETLQAPSSDGLWRLEFTGDRAAAFLTAVRDGNVLQLKPAKGPAVRFSLGGLAASLLWLDDSQGRVGTVTALSKPGSKPASAVPAAPAKPLVKLAKPVSQKGLPKAILPAMKGKLDLGECDVDPKSPGYDLVVARLAPGKLFWGIPCSAGAYNVFYELYTTDEKGGGLKPAIPPYAPGAEDQPTNELMNISFDATKQTLSNFDKMRGIGDCGAQSDWVWDGTAFRLVSQVMMPDCHGVPFDDWPSIWQAQAR
jgi:hypothetical protein